MSRLQNLMRGAKRRVEEDQEPDETMIEDQLEDDTEEEAQDDAPETDAEDDADETDASEEEDDMTAEDEETKKEAAAFNRGATRVLKIMGSKEGKANPIAALKLAANAKLSAGDAIDLLADLPVNAAAAPKTGRLAAALNGKTRALAPDAVGVNKANATSADRILAASKAQIEKRQGR